jgi:hypothetical protein
MPPIRTTPQNRRKGANAPGLYHSGLGARDTAGLSGQQQTQNIFSLPVLQVGELMQASLLQQQNDKSDKQTDKRYLHSLCVLRAYLEYESRGTSPHIPEAALLLPNKCSYRFNTL